MLDNIEQYKSQQLEKLRDNYTQQVSFQIVWVTFLLIPTHPIFPNFRSTVSRTTVHSRWNGFKTVTSRKLNT